MEKLSVVAGKTKGKSYLLNSKTVTIGRDPSCTICIPEDNIAGFDLTIVREENDWVISSVDNNLMVNINGRERQSHKLRDSDIVKIGSSLLRFEQLVVGAVHEPPKTLGPVAAAPSKEPNLSPDTIKQLRIARDKVTNEVSKVIVGQHQIIEEVLIALFSRGHCLLVGVPGLAKTLMIHTISAALDLEFKRIQFTPDLMPSDITGTEILHEDPVTHERLFRFIRGPIFTNMLLADEINRTPPKTQAALLEAMQEHRVTAAGTTYTLPEPFFVLATQNPIEHEGTYPLPEAQLDRFMFMLKVDYPLRADEITIVQKTTQEEQKLPEMILSGAQILELQNIVRRIPVSDYVVTYATDLVRSTRPKTTQALKFINEYVTWGAGPRAAQYLILGAKARSMLSGRVNVSCNDVKAVAPIVLRHRIFTNFNADSEGITSDTIIEMLLKEVKEPSATDLPAGHTQGKAVPQSGTGLPK